MEGGEHRTFNIEHRTLKWRPGAGRVWVFLYPPSSILYPRFRERRAGGYNPGVKGTIVQVNVSGGGMPKRAVSGGVRVTVDGVEGDWQRNRKYHGGPNR